jgi:uncharacterized protein (DUF2267 family)
MDYDAVIAIVQQASGLGREPAERALQATLETLAERIPDGEARQLAGRLPPEMAPWLATTTPAEGFDVDEFIRRVAEREDVDPLAAERHVRAVFAALGRALDDDELRDIASVLPAGFRPLLPRGPHLELISSDAFLQRVTEHAPVDLAGARRATEAVLETLAERIAGGEVDDLIARLPMALHEPLRRGKERSGGKATRMSLDEFLRRVAEREGVDVDTARDHAHGVLLALREAVSDDEFFDVTVQLPAEFVDQLALARH